MINWRFRAALALFEALRMHGIGYVADAATPYLKLSEQAEAVDLLRFPVETLVAKAGDCDDLSILYAALLESVSIPAAFVTTPGHIFVAFNLGLDKKAAADTFSNQADLIFREDGSVWMPVEVTLVRDGFQRAWKTGAQEWAAAAAGGKTEIRAAARGVEELPGGRHWRRCCRERLAHPRRSRCIRPPPRRSTSSLRLRSRRGRTSCCRC